MRLLEGLTPATTRLATVLALSVGLHVAGFAWLAGQPAPRPAAALQGDGATMSVSVAAPGDEAPIEARAAIELDSRVKLPAALRPLAQLRSDERPDLVPRAAPATIAADNAQPATGASPVPTDFLPSSKVDREAYPLNPPDASVLERIPAYSGGPVGLRIYVGPDGHVVKAEVRYASMADEAAAKVMASAYEHINYLPARADAANVGSYFDFEISLTDDRGHTASK